MLTPNVAGHLSLAKTHYVVPEDCGAVAVCVEVSGPNESCPIGFPFRLSLAPLRGTAGKVGMLCNGGLVNDHLFLSLQILMWIMWHFLEN